MRLDHLWLGVPFTALTILLRLFSLFGYIAMSVLSFSVPFYLFGEQPVDSM